MKQWDKDEDKLNKTPPPQFDWIITDQLIDIILSKYYSKENMKCSVQMQYAVQMY